MSRQQDSQSSKAVRKNLASDLRSLNVQATYEDQPSLDDYIAAKIRAHHNRIFAGQRQTVTRDVEDEPREPETREYPAPTQNAGEDLIASYRNSANPYSLDSETYARQQEDHHYHEEHYHDDNERLGDEPLAEDHSFGDIGQAVYKPEEDEAKIDERIIEPQEHHDHHHHADHDCQEEHQHVHKQSEEHSHTQTQKSHALKLTETCADEDFPRSHNQTLNLKSLEEASPKKIHRGETLVGVNRNSYLTSRYHALRQHAPKIRRETIRFVAERIEPPQCLLDILDALFSLVHGMFTPLEQDYFNNLHKKYHHFKHYLKHSDELITLLGDLKQILERDGLPTKNLLMADKALCRYKKSVKHLEFRNYAEMTNEIYRYVYYFLEYFNIMRVDDHYSETPA